MNEINEAILRLKKDGLTNKQLAEELNAKGIYTTKGKRWMEGNLSMYIKRLVMRGDLPVSKYSRKDSPLVKMKRAKKPMTIPVDEHTSLSKNKMIAVLGEAEDIEKLIAGWMR